MISANFPGQESKFWQNKAFQNNAWGVFWKTLACAAFAGVNSLVHYLTGGVGDVEKSLSTGVVVLFESIFACMIMLPFLLKDGIGILKTTRPTLHAIRILAGVFGVIALYTSFAKMPMAQAVALQFTGPLFTVIGAKIYLKERVGFIRLLGIFLGIVGAVILTRPDKALLADTFDYKSLVVFLPMASAVLFVVSKLCSRSLAKVGEKPQLLAFYFIFFMIPVSGAYAYADWQMPTHEQFLLLVSLGFCGCLAHYSTAKAYSLSEVLFLTPFGFSRFLFTALLGYVLFFEFPKNEFAWFAYAFIMLSVITITLGETRLKKEKQLAQQKTA